MPSRPGYELAKRAFDTIVATALLIGASPLALTAALLIRVTSPGPIIFSQRRVGQGGRTFQCYKFRTMCDRAEAILWNSPLRFQYEAQWKLEHDSRVTPVGKWLRKTSIDELPQLINVLRGEMSIVGPRPVQPRELTQRFGPLAEVVTSVKPGLTSLWSISGRSTLRYEERVQLDVEYVRRRGFWCDLMVVLRTVPAVLFQRGAV